jgi:glucosylceramidase
MGVAMLERGRNWRVLSVGALVATVLVVSGSSEPKANASTSDCAPISGFSTTFCDGFGGSNPNQSLWTVDPNGGVVSESNGSLNLSSSTGTFPYIVSNSDPFPSSGSFRLTVGFQYDSVGGYGDGIVASDTSIPDGAGISGAPPGIWQDSAGLRFFAAFSGCPSAELPAPDTAPHVAQFDFTNDSVQVSLDGTDYGSCALTADPVSLWMGNPGVPASCGCQWSTLSISYVRVDIPSGIQFDLTNGASKVYSHPFSQPTLNLGPATSSSANITLDPADTFQTIDGFGGTLTGSAAADLMALGTYDTTNICQNAVPLSSASTNIVHAVNTLFSPTSGAGISLVRISMGANDFSPNGDYTYDDPPPTDTTKQKKSYSDPQLKNFSIAPDLKAVIPILKLALAVNPKLQVIASPWTAPPWMKTNDTGTSASYTGSGGTLNLGDYGVYAKYFLKFVQAYQSCGIPIDYVTPQNEPGYTPTTYPAMSFSPQAEETFVDEDLGPTLAGTHVSILDYDWNWNNKCTSKSTNTCWTQAQIQAVFTGVPFKNGTPSNVAGIAWHCYSDPPDTAAAQSTFEQSYPKTTWLQFITECTGSGPDKSGFPGNLDWDSTNLIVGGLKNWASGVQLYNLALNQGCGPQTVGGTSCVDPSPPGKPCEDCRGVLTIDTRTSPATVTKRNVEYYILTEAANAFEPGAVIIATCGGAGPMSSVMSSDCTSEDDLPSSLEAVAALNPDHSTGLFVGNPTAKSISLNLDDNGEGFSYPIPANSVASFRWTN